jgi:hypothetical protein
MTQQRYNIAKSKKKTLRKTGTIFISGAIRKRALRSVHNMALWHVTEEVLLDPREDWNRRVVPGRVDLGSL